MSVFYSTNISYSSNGAFKRRLVYSIGLISGTSSALLAYIQSSFLTLLVDEKYIGIIYTASSILTLILINYFVQIINKFSNKAAAVFIVAATFLSLLMMASEIPQSAKLLFFVVYTITIPLFYINADIFLEKVSKNEETGRIRGIYWTLVNVGWVISPLCAGLLLEKFGFPFVFSLSASLLSISFFIIIFGFKKSEEYKYRHPPFLETLKETIKRSEIRNIFAIALLLQFFYAWMVIYMPIYLHSSIGLPWSEIGLAFTIMLIPFVLIEYPAGYLADKCWGEKEMLIFGLFVMSLVSLGFFFIKSSDWIIWAAILFLSRVGASLVEIMRDTYFFKQIDGKDIHLINFFRNTMPLAYIMAPMAASFILFFYDIKFLFPVLSAMILFGSYFALILKDTK